MLHSPPPQKLFRNDFGSIETVLPPPQIHGQVVIIVRDASLYNGWSSSPVPLDSSLHFCHQVRFEIDELVKICALYCTS